MRGRRVVPSMREKCRGRPLECRSCRRAAGHTREPRDRSHRPPAPPSLDQPTVAAPFRPRLGHPPRRHTSTGVFCPIMRRDSCRDDGSVKIRNEPGTNHGRIADSKRVGIRSPPDVGTVINAALPDQGRRYRCLHLVLTLAINSLPPLAFLTEPGRWSGLRAGRCGADTNWVACITPRPSGVGMLMRNGTTTRVPATGANQISMSRWAIRYLIAGRSGM